jgi:hypothetical protein
MIEINTVKNFPIGLSTLGAIRNGYYYVDKTAFVEKLVNQGKYYFLSRPRRFGKSLLLDTLKQAFLGNRDVFKGLYLEDRWDWKKTHPVIHISFASNQVVSSLALFETKITELLQNIAADHHVALSGELYSTQFSRLINDIQCRYQQNVVILIDEYDKPILDTVTDISLAAAIRDSLRSFYSVIKDHDDKIQFVFFTGVSKFAKSGVFSGLNHLNDITYHDKYATICGYTQQELEDTFRTHLIPEDLPTIKAWYNGYYFLGQEGIYNPFSILNYLERGKVFANYWFATGTPTFLIDLLKQRRFYIPHLEKIEVTENSLQSFDVDYLPLIPLLLQTGYLTITGTRLVGITRFYALSYPNLEVKQSLNDCLAEICVATEVKNDTYLAMHEALSRHHFGQLKLIFTRLFASIPHDWYRNNDIQHYEGFYCAMVYSYFMGLGYTAIAEDVTSQGKIDITVILDHSIVIIEFKLAQSGDAESAIQQIKDKQYANKYLGHEKPIYLLGLSFDAENRNVKTCAFELMAMADQEKS